MVTASFPTWPDGAVRDFTGMLPVRPPIAKTPDEPVSQRLIAMWPHPDRSGGISQLQFSPDKKSLFGSSYPGGIVQKWDLATGKQTLRIDTVSGLRASSQTANFSGDGKRLYVSFTKQEVKTVEKEGKRLNRFIFNSEIRVWDAGTGKPLDPLRHEPPGYIVHLQMLPDGKQAMVMEEPPGDYLGRPPREAWIVNLEGNRWTKLPKEITPFGAFSPDGNVYCAPVTDESNYVRKLAWYSVPGFKLIKDLPIEGAAPSGGSGVFSADGRLFATLIQQFPKPNQYDTFTSELLLVEVAGGRIIGRWSPKDAGSNYGPYAFSPDAKTLAFVNGSPPRGTQMHPPICLYLADLATGKIRQEVQLEGNEPGSYTQAFPLVFNSDGTLLAVASRRIPLELAKVRDSAKTEDYPQGRIHVIEVATGRVVEKMTNTHCGVISMLFSPDGLTLYAGGFGKGLVFDLSGLPTIRAK